jgi:hypothetical protein
MSKESNGKCVRVSTRDVIRLLIGNIGFRLESKRLNVGSIVSPLTDGVDGHVLLEDIPRMKFDELELLLLLLETVELFCESLYFLSENLNFSVPGSFGGFILFEVNIDSNFILTLKKLSPIRSQRAFHFNGT